MLDAALTRDPSLHAPASPDVLQWSIPYLQFKSAVMTDEHYFSLLLWTISVLMFACSVAALTQHPEWFGA